MLSISEVAKEKKNNLADTGSWLVLLDVSNKTETIAFHICSNTEDVEFESVNYVAFPFDLDPIVESSKGELPTFSLKVSNVGRIIQGYIESDPDFGSGWDVRIRVAHSSNLVGGAEIEYNFTSLSATADENNAVFLIGMKNPLRQQFPRRKFMTDTCQHTFTQGGCTYAGQDTHCGRTLADCRIKFPNTDALPILSFPAIPTGAIYK